MQYFAQTFYFQVFVFNILELLVGRGVYRQDNWSLLLVGQIVLDGKSNYVINAIYQQRLGR